MCGFFSGVCFLSIVVSIVFITIGVAKTHTHIQVGRLLSPLLFFFFFVSPVIICFVLGYLRVIGDISATIEDNGLYDLCWCGRVWFEDSGHREGVKDR